MKKFIFIFSHQATAQQLEGVMNQYGINEVTYLPKNISAKWSQVPTDLSSLTEYSKTFIDWLELESNVGDIILIQGEFGLTYLMVTWCFLNNRVPIHAVSERKSSEHKTENGKIIRTQEFFHKRFRNYQTL